MSLIESNKHIVEQYVAAFNAGDLASLRSLFTEDALIYGVLGAGGLQVALPIWSELHSAFGLTLIIEELVAEGDRVAARYIERGTMVGSFRGQAPTGKSYEVPAMEWFIIKDGRISQRWGARDFAAISRQLGI